MKTLYIILVAFLLLMSTATGGQDYGVVWVLSSFVLGLPWSLAFLAAPNIFAGNGDQFFRWFCVLGALLNIFLIFKLSSPTTKKEYAPDEKTDGK